MNSITLCRTKMTRINKQLGFKSFRKFKILNEAKNISCLAQILIKNQESKIKELKKYFRSQILQKKERVQEFKFYLKKKKSEKNSDYLVRIYLDLIIFINENIGLVQENLTEFLKHLKSFLKLKKNFPKVSPKHIKTGIELLPKIHDSLIENFVHFLNLKYNFDSGLLNNLITSKILSLKFNTALKLITIFEIRTNSIIELFLKTCYQDKINYGFIKDMLQYEQTYIKDVFNKFFEMGWNKHLSDLYIDLKLQDPELLRQVKIRAEFLASDHHLFTYIDHKNSLINLYELFENNYDVLNYLVGRLNKKNFFDESMFIVNQKDIKFFKKESISLLNKFMIQNLNGNLPSLSSNDYDNYSLLFQKYKLVHSNHVIQRDDQFLPWDQNCLKLKISEKKVFFIDNIENARNLENLKETILGFDSEWKPSMTKFDKKKNASILQFSTESSVCIIDGDLIESNPEFRKAFREFLKNKVIVCFGFKSDLAMMNKEITDILVNNNKIVNLEDLLDRSLKLTSLASVVQFYLKKSLCKIEQCSNWDLRPLRKRQLHYAALDAYCLVNLYEILSKNK